jgi:hypothetical protein
MYYVVTLVAGLPVVGDRLLDLIFIPHLQAILNQLRHVIDTVT